MLDSVRQFLRTTLVGGIIFLIPLVFVVAVLGKALQITKSVAVPIGNLIPIESVAGVAIVPILMTVILFLSCFLAGVAARSPAGQRVYKKLDTILLRMIPGYAWVKGVTGDISDEDAEKALKPVMVRFDDQHQLAFEVDRTADGLVAVYLPGAPDPHAGTVSFVTSDRVQSIDAGFKAVTRVCKNFGRGSGTVLSKR